MLNHYFCVIFFLSLRLHLLYRRFVCSLCKTHSENLQNKKNDDSKCLNWFGQFIWKRRKPNQKQSEKKVQPIHIHNTLWAKLCVDAIIDPIECEREKKTGCKRESGEKFENRNMQLLSLHSLFYFLKIYFVREWYFSKKENKIFVIYWELCCVNRIKREFICCQKEKKII